MDKLVGELLTLSQLDTGMMRPANERVHMGELLAAVVDDARFEAKTMGRDVALSEASRVVVNGSAELLRRATENVVRNAVRHTPQGSTVGVHAQIDGAALRISVRDHGPGVPEPDLEKIFEPFFRVGRDSGDGYGQGLAIARRVIEAHGGEIRAANDAGGGLRVEIVLPVK
jgi:two-component system OmpR family sensor kinase